MTFLARVSVTLALVAGTTFAGAFAVPAPACAGAGPRAVLVVDTGEAEQRMCVALPRAQVSGADLIVLAGEQHGLSYRFGYGGGAVCMLAGVGTSGDDCFEKYPDFWGYWRGNGSGGWSWSSTGAGSTRVSDGDVEGWSWGSGSDGSSHPAPPSTSFSSVCPAAAAPAAPARRPSPRAAPRPAAESEREPEPSSGSGDGGSVPASAPEARERSGARPQEADGLRRRARRAGTTTDRRDRNARPREEPVDAAIGSDPISGTPPPGGRGGPPPAGVAAFAAAGVLSAAGAWIARRRRLGP